MTVTDGYRGSVEVPVEVAVGPANIVPVAEVVSLSGPDPLTGVVAGVMSAGDADGDPITYSVPVSTAKGAITFDSDGSFTYTPTAQARHAAAREGATDAEMTDSFAVTFTDGYGGAVQVPVNVSIAPANSAPQVLAASADEPDESTGAVNGVVSASDADGDVLVYSGSTDTAKGSVVVNADGSFSYTPTAVARHDAARDGAGIADPSELFDVFTITVNDGYGAAVEVPVVVTISPSNAAPVVGSVTTGVPEESDGRITGSVTASDADGDRLIFTGTAATEKGSVIVNPTGEFVYTPTEEARRAASLGEGGEEFDTFTVTVADGFGGSVEVPVQVSVTPAVTFYLAGDVKRDPLTGSVALRTTFPEDLQDPFTGASGYLNWLEITSNRGANNVFPTHIESWETLFLTGSTPTNIPYSASIDLPPNAVLRNPENGAIAIRTVFPEVDFPESAWLAATTSQGARNLASTSVEGWVILFVPGR